jgi:hypothetical protein
MSDKPSYRMAYDQRTQDVQDSIKTEHTGPKQPMQDSDSIVGKTPGTNKPAPGSIELGVGSSN